MSKPNSVWLRITLPDGSTVFNGFPDTAMCDSYATMFIRDAERDGVTVDVEMVRHKVMEFRPMTADEMAEFDSEDIVPPHLMPNQNEAQDVAFTETTKY